MNDIDLKLKLNWPDTPNDYAVIWTSERWGEFRIGRIRFADERYNVGRSQWDWHVNLPLAIPAWCNGSSDSRDEAAKAFRKAWETFLAGLSETKLQHAFDVQRAAQNRLKALER